MSQYGIRVLTKEFNTVSWDEFRTLLAGISPDTALGRVVSIRAENDPEVLKHFTKEQHRIRNEWRKKQAQAVSKVDMAAVLNSFEAAFIAMAGV